MLIKIVVLFILVLIVVSLFKALSSLVKNESGSGKTVKLLAYRVGFSVLLLVFLGLSSYMGWVSPHDLKGKPTTSPVISASEDS